METLPMVSTSFVDHVSHVFFGSLGLALLLGLVRGAAPRLTRERRAARVVGIPLVFFVGLMALAHAASFAPPSVAPAMAVALVSPVSRESAVRKLGTRIRESDKTERTVNTLVALDLSVHDCLNAESDAYRYRARAGWAKVIQACGPSELAARALFEEGRLEDAALAFESARKARPGQWLAIDELTAYVLTKRASLAGAALRTITPKHASLTADLSCLADAFEIHAGSRTSWGPALGVACDDVRAALARSAAQPAPPPALQAPAAPATCVPHRNTEPRDVQIVQSCSGPDGYPFRPTEPAPFASEADGAASRASWLSQIDDHEGALALADRELGKFTWNAPLYPRALRDEHDALVARAWGEDPGNLWVRADCSRELRVPPGHPLAARVAKDRELYDAIRAEADWANLSGRDRALKWAYALAVHSLEGARAQGYWARHSAPPSAPGELTTFTSDSRLPLLLAFSGASADLAFGDADAALHEAAVAGSGTRLARRLRALDGTGEGTLDVMGKTIPEGQASLVAFLRFDARIACDRRTMPMDQRAPRCTALALVRALGVRHRLARAVDDGATVREAHEALDRVLGHEGGAWLRDQRLAALFAVADRLLTVPEGER